MIALPTGETAPPRKDDFCGDIGGLERFEQMLRANPNHPSRKEWHVPFLAGNRMWDLEKHCLVRVGRNGVVCRVHLEYSIRGDVGFIEFIANFYSPAFNSKQFSMNDQDLMYWHTRLHARQHCDENRQIRAYSRRNMAVWFECYGDERDEHEH